MTTRFEKTCETPRKLMDELDKSKEEGYVWFRGMPLRKYQMIPSGYRPSDIAGNIDRFPGIMKEWICNNEVLDVINLSFKIGHENIEKHQGIKRFLYMNFYLFVCNYFFYKYKEGNPAHVYTREREHLELRNSKYWSDRNNFILFVQVIGN